MPVVEDPGSFAVRGALLDVWSPRRQPRRAASSSTATSSSRFGRSTRTASARRRSTARRSRWPRSGCPPRARPILTRDTARRAREAARRLADAIDLPSTRARALVEDVAGGRSFFGADGFLPAYYDALEPLASYLDGGPAPRPRRPSGHHGGARKRARARDGRRRSRREREAPLPAATSSTRMPRASRHVLEGRATVALPARRPSSARTTPADEAEPSRSRATRSSGAPREPLDLGARDHADLTRAVRPLARRAARPPPSLRSRVASPTGASTACASSSPRAPTRRPSA